MLPPEVEVPALWSRVAGPVRMAVDREHVAMLLALHRECVIPVPVLSVGGEKHVAPLKFWYMAHVWRLAQRHLSQNTNARTYTQPITSVTVAQARFMIGSPLASAMLLRE